MAVTHISYNHGTPHGQMLDNSLRQFEHGLNGLVSLKASMATMIDGDGSNVSHFTYMADKFGFVDTTAAKAAWDELNSSLFKLTTNSSVSDVNAAILQLQAKLR